VKDIFLRITGRRIRKVISDAARLLINTAISPILKTKTSTRFNDTFVTIFIIFIVANIDALFCSLRYANGTSVSASKNKIKAEYMTKSGSLTDIRSDIRPENKRITNDKNALFAIITKKGWEKFCLLLPISFDEANRK
jgi:hypothetical protein